MPDDRPRRANTPSGEVLRRYADLTPQRARLDAECKRLLAQLRARCPQVLPREPVPAGTVVDEVTLDHEGAAHAVRLGVMTAAGADPGGDGPLTVLWRKGDLQLLVHVSEVDITFRPGTAEVRIPVSCDEVEGVATVVFAVGGPDRPAGLLAVAEARPRGPEAVVSLWADELLALAWHGLMEGVSGVAGAAGRDVDGAALIPAALTVSGDGVAVEPMARHHFDRVTGR